VCRRLQLKSCAELALGQNQRAFEDVNLILRVSDSLESERFLISYLVRVACLQSAIQPIWEGLAEHRWTDEQLQSFQQRLQQYNFVADVKVPFESERAAHTAVVQLIKKRGLGYLIDLTSGSVSLPSFDRDTANWLGKAMPSGWLYLEEYSCCRGYDQLLGGTTDPSNKRVFPQRSRANDMALEREFKESLFSTVFVHHRVLGAILLPAINRVIIKAATAQTVANQATLACALERYRLASEQFPESLDALMPRYISQLPHDVITGEPYKYRRTNDGQFILYSVGWNEKDDGGVPGKTLFDEKEGDWVWQYPARS